MRDAEVAELALLRGEEAADSHRGFRLFRDVALRGRTLRLAKPVGGVTRVPRRGVVSLRYLELREVPESVHLGGYLGRVGKVGVVGTRRKVPSGKRECVPLTCSPPLAQSAAATTRRCSRSTCAACSTRSFVVSQSSASRSASRRASNARRTSASAMPTVARLAGSHECYSWRQQPVWVCKSLTQEPGFKSPRLHLIVQLCMAPLHQPARPFLAKCASR